MRTLLNLLLESVNAVEPHYYGEGNYLRMIMENHSFHFTRIERWDAQKLDSLERFINSRNERTFCYELYFQMRHRLVQSSIIDRDIILQGEANKMKLLSFVKEYGFEPLEETYWPDFIFHQPASGNKQLAIIEVKADRQLNFADFAKDTTKIKTLMDNYRFHIGIFLMIFTTKDQLDQHLYNYIKGSGVDIYEIVFVIKPDENSNATAYKCMHGGELIPIHLQQ
jgi:hypothetical protein